MLEIAYHEKSAFNMLWVNGLDLKKYEFSESEWIIAEELLRFLRFYKQATKTVSKEQEASLPSSVVIFNLLLDRIESIIFDLQKKIDEGLSRELIDEKLLLAF